MAGTEMLPAIIVISQIKFWPEFNEFWPEFKKFRPKFNAKSLKVKRKDEHLGATIINTPCKRNTKGILQLRGMILA